MISLKLSGNAVKTSVVAVAFFVVARTVLGAGPGVTHPFEIARPGAQPGPIDKLVLSTLRDQGIQPANMCSDEVFVRRVCLDVIGTLPDPQVVRTFAEDKRPRKRALFIDRLLEREEFADYWAMKWCDLLRVKAEFPINLWPNGVQAYHRWIRDSIRENKPYDQFVRELLTSSGSNFRVAPVNFYRAIQEQEPSSIASAVALTFMGTRLESMPEKQRIGMETLFSRVAFKPTAEWKEEIICLDPSQVDTSKTVFPDGKRADIEPGEDPRQVFADWLITEDNEWFARCAVNRLWSWLMGRGIIHEPDDIRPDNPAVNPKLLSYLEKELVNADYDMKHVYRLILNSGTYQQSSIPRSDHPDAEALSAHYAVRRLEAEVLIDALNWIFGAKESYSSAAPEPYTFIPDNQRTILLADGSITSQFLEMYGRPARDTGTVSERNNQPTDGQRLHLLNSTHIQQKIEKSWWLNGAIKRAKGKHSAVINGIYMRILTRLPTESELATAEKYAKTKDIGLKNGAIDISWALINSKEFLYRH
jgi:hypothetical protein